MNVLTDTCGAIGTFVTTLAVTTETSENPWISLACSALSAVIYFLLSLGVKALTTIMKNKGLITDDQKKAADDKADDLADDGKLNDSNKDSK